MTLKEQVEQLTDAEIQEAIAFNESELESVKEMEKSHPGLVEGQRMKIHEILMVLSFEQLRRSKNN